MPEKKKKNYVDPELLLSELSGYIKENKRFEKGLIKVKPQIPEYVGESILKIAVRLSQRPNFSKYVYREDMIGDAVENCLKYIHNFNPKKSKNAFSYFTTIIWWAFIRRIESEKKQMVIKLRSIQRSPFFEDMTRQVGDEGSYDNAYVKFIRKHIDDYVLDFENKMNSKKEKNKKNAIKKGSNLEKMF